jgi:LysM repeat protein
MRVNAFLAGLATVTVIFAVGGKTAHAQTPTSDVANNPPASTSTPAPKIVEVQPGDYLAKIADENQTTYPRLYDANPDVQNPNLIYPGQKLRVPTADEQLTDRSPAQVAPAPVASAPVKITPKRTPAPRPAPVRSAPVAVGDGSVWDRLAQCESGGNWHINTGNGFYGGLQFTLGSWHGVGGVGLPSDASREEQIARAQMLQARQGWGAWPACTAKLGIR